MTSIRTAADQLSDGRRIRVTYLASRSPFRTRLLGGLWAVSRLSRSESQPEAGDHLEPVDLARARFTYEHFSGSGEVEQEAADAGLIVLPHREHPHARPLLVLTRPPTATGGARR